MSWKARYAMAAVSKRDMFVVGERIYEKKGNKGSFGIFEIILLCYKDCQRSGINVGANSFFINYCYLQKIRFVIPSNKLKFCSFKNIFFNGNPHLPNITSQNSFIFFLCLIFLSNHKIL